MIKHLFLFVFLLFSIVTTTAQQEDSDSSETQQRQVGDQSLKEITSDLLEALQTGNYFKVSPYLPNDEDIEYFVRIAIDQRPELFKEARNQERLYNRFEEHAKVIRDDFRANFDTLRMELNNSGISFPSDSAFFQQSVSTEAGITEAEVHIHTLSNHGESIYMKVTKTSRGWTWAGPLRLEEKAEFSPNAYPSVCDCVDAEKNDIDLNQACNEKYAPNALTEDQIELVEHLSTKCKKE